MISKSRVFRGNPSLSAELNAFIASLLSKASCQFESRSMNLLLLRLLSKVHRAVKTRDVG